jgi:hypothetical protein
LRHISVLRLIDTNDDPVIIKQTFNKPTEQILWQDILLDIAKIGSDGERAMAKEALAFMEKTDDTKKLDPMLVNVVKAQQRVVKKVAEKIENQKQ